MTLFQSRPPLNFWSKISPWIDKQQFAFTTVSILGGLSMIFIFLSKDVVHSPSDLLPFSGKLSHYSFINGKRGSKEYYLWLDKYSGPFQIPADFLFYFKEREFTSQINTGSEIKLKIAKSELEDLNKGNITVIFELETIGIKYLDSNATILENKKRTLLYGGLALMVTGMLYYIYRRKYPLRSYY